MAEDSGMNGNSHFQGNSELYKSTEKLLEDDKSLSDQIEVNREITADTRLLFTIPVISGDIFGIEVWTNQIYLPPNKKRAAKILHKDTIYAFHLSTPGRGGIDMVTYEDKKTKKTRRVYELLVQSEDPSQSSNEAEGYVTRLREWLWEISIDVGNLNEQWWKKYLIVVNPFSGYQKGRRRFFKVVQPIMDECRIKYDVIFTERSMQGIEIGRTTPPGKYDAIIGMSGDGLINEILNAMMNRPDKEEALKMSLGAIANGTSNCFAAEVMDTHGDASKENSLINSTLHVIKGKPKKMNLQRIQVGTSKTVFHCFQLITWGMLANLEFESIPLRKFGPLRLTIYTMKHLILKKKFLTEIWIKLVPRNQWNPKYAEYMNKSPHWSVDKDFINSVKAVLAQPAEKTSSQVDRIIPVEDQLPVSSNWVKIPSTEFLFVSFTTMRRWGLDLIGCKLLEHEDKCGYVVLGRHPIKRLDILRAFFMMEKGNHQNLNSVEIYCVNGLRMQPDTMNGPRTYICLDGEKQLSQNYQIDVLPDAVNFLF